MKKRKILLGLAAGIAAGGMLAAAFATNKGKEIRKKINNKGFESMDKLQEKFNHFVKKFSKKFEFSKKKIKQKFEKGKQNAGDIKHDLKPGAKDPVANSVAAKKGSSEVH